MRLLNCDRTFRKQIVSPEDLEYFECQRQMLDELFSQYTLVERIIGNELIISMKSFFCQCLWCIPFIIQSFL